jgi:replicative DNA helicase
VSVAEFPSHQSPTELARTPPQDIAAEQSVLGGMLLSKDAIADVLEAVRGHDFYRPAHELVYESILDLYGRGEPADAVTVSAELQKRGELARVGGAPYLHTLISSVPTAANAGYYARIVRETAILRRLIEAGTKIVQLGYTGDGDADEIVDAAQAEVYNVTDRRTSEDYLPLSAIMEGTLDEIEAIGSRGGEMVGVPTGFQDFDELTNGLHPGQMIVIAARPAVGKSTLGLDIARAAAIKANMTTCVFSLEMSRNEITMRLLSAEARVALHHMRTGKLTDDDWTRLARRMGEVSNAPLFIDDSPNMSMMEIRAKCRRLKQRHDLKLVIIDYLQLMSSGKRVESRQQEVSEFSRAIKLLAKELEVPVIAISQLNRGSEQRTDKKPQMSDLRESGCLPASTRIMRADTGAEVTLGELMDAGARDVPVWSLDDSLRYRARTMTHVFSSGRKAVFTLTTTSGKTIQATANHPFLTYDGWRPLEELSAGTRLAVPRHVPTPLDSAADRAADRAADWADAEVTLLAHLLGAGSFVRRQPVRYASLDEANLSAVAEAAEHFGVQAVRDDRAAARGTTLRLPAPRHPARGRRNPVAAWLDELGLFGARSHEKFLPAQVFTLPKRQIALFLRHIWATDGSVTITKGGRTGRVSYGSTSRRLVDDLARLLLRFGISSRVRAAGEKAAYPQGYTLDIPGGDDQRRFLGEIGVHGSRRETADRLLSAIRSIPSNTDVDTVPVEVWEKVRQTLVAREVGHRAFASATGTQSSGSALWEHAPSRERLGRVATLLEDADLEMLATNDVLWDTVASIESAGVQEVFDATVLGSHNFIADGLAVHNSIEQDADMVVLLHREELYERESPRAGEADFIVAKHRNGPTATITVAFQGHYSRFVDMAQS